MPAAPFENPFRPGAGHRPPYLAGRKPEKEEFKRLLGQKTVTDNLVLTGLRGVGKTVLLDELKPIALAGKWLWVGTDLSESASISEANMAQRLITDLSVVTSSMVVASRSKAAVGFSDTETKSEIRLGYETLMGVYNNAPGLIVDKIKAVFSIVSICLAETDRDGIVFAYDEAQNLADHAVKEQYPLSVLLDAFQSVQRQGVPFLLVLVGLPTLFPKLVNARTYTERMFRVITLGKLSKDESVEAIETPIKTAGCPVKFMPKAVELIYENSGGYPYFIQFICREAYDSYLQQASSGETPKVPIPGIIRKLDSDFFAGRWAKVTDRQQQLLFVIANLDSTDIEFTVQEILAKADDILMKSFSRSHISQLLVSLINSGLIYKDRHGKYLFAVPLMADFIKRTMDD